MDLKCLSCKKEIGSKEFYVQYDLETNEEKYICIECLENMMRNAILKRGVPDDDV